MLDVMSAPIVTELPRIEGRAAPPVPEPAVPSVDELSVDVELRGAKVRAGARGAGIAALQRVMIVLILVAGAVAIVRSIVMSRETPRSPHIGRCTEPSHTEDIERMGRCTEPEPSSGRALGRVRDLLDRTIQVRGFVPGREAG
jgi:hypothetical protein